MFLPPYLEVAPSLIKLGKNIVKSKYKSNSNALSSTVADIFTDEQKRVIEEISSEVEKSKQEIIQKIDDIIQQQKMTEIIGMVNGVLISLENYYDSPSANAIDSKLDNIGNIIGTLTAALDYFTNPLLLKHTFALYILSLLLYSMMQMERIRLKQLTDDQINSISKRIVAKVNEIEPRSNNTVSRLQKVTEGRFTTLEERKYEPVSNYYTLPGRRKLYYIYEYNFDNEAVEAKKVECKICHPKDYERIYKFRKDLVVKTTLEGAKFVWPLVIDREKIREEAENIRKEHIKQIFNTSYNEFILVKDESIEMVKPILNSLEIDK